jgi:hypothetical protein
MTTDNAKCTREIKFKLAVTKVTVNNKKTFHHQNILKFKELTSETYIWSRALYDAEN